MITVLGDCNVFNIQVTVLGIVFNYKTLSLEAHLLKRGKHGKRTNYEQ